MTGSSPSVKNRNDQKTAGRKRWQQLPKNCKQKEIGRGGEPHGTIGLEPTIHGIKNRRLTPWPRPTKTATVPDMRVCRIPKNPEVEENFYDEVGNGGNRTLDLSYAKRVF